MAKTANGRRRLRTLAIAFTLLLPLLANAATTINFLHPSTMTEEEKIKELYKTMCIAMIDKDTTTLSSIHDDSFMLVHMTGMRQSKQQYIDAIADGTLNYFTVRYDALEATVKGDSATLLARSQVSAAVFGGGRHSWRLQLHFHLIRRDGRWLFTHCEASTY
jgi:ketosteroid isomerase-like protein